MSTNFGRSIAVAALLLLTNNAFAQERTTVERSSAGDTRTVERNTVDRDGNHTRDVRTRSNDGSYERHTRDVNGERVIDREFRGQ